MKPLICIFSCQADRENGRQASAENTWFNEWRHEPVTIKFLLGRTAKDSIMDHELIVDADDGYWGCVHKAQEARKYAFTLGYDYIFQACIDTWIHVPRLLASGFEQHDYIGYYADWPHFKYAGGGSGYWTSAFAARALFEATPPAGNCYDDVWTGDIMHKTDIAFHHDSRYYGHGRAPLKPDEKMISMHLSHSTGGFDPKQMYECHEKEKNNARDNIV